MVDLVSCYVMIDSLLEIATCAMILDVTLNSQPIMAVTLSSYPNCSSIELSSQSNYCNAYIFLSYPNIAPSNTCIKVYLID
jgi:hypothetical protein